MESGEDKREEKQEEEKRGRSKREMRREIIPFLTCGAAVCAVLNVRTGFPAGNIWGAILTGIVFGYIAWGFWNVFRNRR